MTIEKARSVRAARTRQLTHLRTGRLHVADALRRVPSALGGVDLWVVLLACPRMGRERARTVCERANVWPHLTLDELTNSQRAAVIKNLPGKEE